MARTTSSLLCGIVLLLLVVLAACPWRRPVSGAVRWLLSAPPLAIRCFSRGGGGGSGRAGNVRACACRARGPAGLGWPCVAARRAMAPLILNGCATQHNALGHALPADRVPRCSIACLRVMGAGLRGGGAHCDCKHCKARQPHSTADRRCRGVQQVGPSFLCAFQGYLQGGGRVGVCRTAW